MTNKKLIKKTIRKAHLIMGLATGLVVFVVAITGCLWVFQEEIQGLYDDYKNVSPQEKAFITPTQAKKIAENIIPGRHIHGVLYGAPDEAVEVIFYEAEPHEFYQSIFLNPYDGKLLKHVDHEAGFFSFVLHGHLYLWLPESIGTQVVRWSVVIFVLMLITGIILWWPKNKTNQKQRLQFIWKHNTQWKRKNFDLHAILGFYASLVALIFALTGLIMAFEWFEKTTYQALGGEKSVTFTVPKNESEIIAPTEGVQPIDQILPILQAKYPEAKTFEIHYPHTNEYSIYVEINYQKGVYYSSDYRFYDLRSLQELDTPSVYGQYENAGFADKVIRMNYDTHVGSILGLPGKILAFVASLIIASLPVTGFMIWLGRNKKKKRETGINSFNAKRIAGGKPGKTGQKVVTSLD